VQESKSHTRFTFQENPGSYDWIGHFPRMGNVSRTGPAGLASFTIMEKCSGTQNFQVLIRMHFPA